MIPIYLFSSDTTNYKKKKKKKKIRLRDTRVILCRKGLAGTFFPALKGSNFCFSRTSARSSVRWDYDSTEGEESEWTDEDGQGPPGIPPLQRKPTKNGGSVGGSPARFARRRTQERWKPGLREPQATRRSQWDPEFWLRQAPGLPSPSQHNMDTTTRATTNIHISNNHMIRDLQYHCHHIYHNNLQHKTKQQPRGQIIQWRHSLLCPSLLCHSLQCSNPHQCSNSLQSLNNAAPPPDVTACHNAR